MFPCILYEEKNMKWQVIKYWNKFFTAQNVSDAYSSFELIPVSTEQFCCSLLEKWLKQYKLGHIRQVAIPFSAVNSRRSQSSNVSLVVLDKLLFSTLETSFLKK